MDHHHMHRELAGHDDGFTSSGNGTLPRAANSAAIHDHGDNLLRPPPPDYTTAELPPIQTFTGNRNNHKKTDFLPSLSTLTASSPPIYPTAAAPHHYGRPPQYDPKIHAHPPPHSQALPQSHTWPSLNPLAAYYAPHHAAQPADSPMRMDTDAASCGSATSPERLTDPRASSVSLDDPEVRKVVEALGDLRAENRDVPLSTSTPAQPKAPEPLLALLTTHHPLVGQTIQNTMSAYVASKNYSPRFKSSAELAERCVLPIANTVGSVGLVTGMHDSVRWFLTPSGRPESSTSVDEAGDGNNKRKREKTSEDGDETASGATTPRPTHDSLERRLSAASTVGTLPPDYDEYRSPPYTEPTSRPPSSSPWSSRIALSTSGLSIAMSEESLRSLKYCLRWLRWANEHIGTVIDSLKTTMDTYEGSAHPNEDQPMLDSGLDSERGSESTDPRDKQALADKINALRQDVVNTLQQVINTVSKYAGGALPENAKNLVRRHLTSLPDRFHLASIDAQSTSGWGSLSEAEAGNASEKEMRESSKKVLVLAKEGLEMLGQVSAVLDGTINSAEEWCERLGKKKRQQRAALMEGPAPPGSQEDVKMG